MKYKITLDNQIIALKGIIITLVYFVGFCLYALHNARDKNFTLVFFSIGFIIVLLPVIYLHIEYYHFNKDIELDIEPFENKMIYKTRTGEVKIIFFNEISKFIFYMDPSWHRKSNFRILPFAIYHYASIFTKSGEKIVITSLMMPRVEDALSVVKGVPIEKKIRWFASILIG